MSRTLSVPKIFAVCLFAQLGLAQAQAPSQQRPSDAPPKLERIEEGSDTPITVTPQRNSGKKITEKREGGTITEVQVKSGKSTYTMKATPPGSVVQTGENAGTTLRPPQWKVMEFDIGKRKHPQSDEAVPAASEPAPPPPPPPASK